jgi:prephenate dehydrogenase
LIGGSIGMAVRQRALARRVLGVGRNRERLEAARELGAIDAWETELAAGVRGADGIVICTPVESIVGQVREIAAACPPTAWITDAGSIKGEICRALEVDGLAGRFVGSHPMAGSEKTGAQHGQADLFEDRVTIVTPTAGSPKPLVEQVESFWRELGSRVFRMSPEEHDEVVARTSHLPHLAASVVASATPAAWLPFTAGGWADTTRVAAGDVELWRQILVGNRGQVVQAIDEFTAVLAEVRRSLAGGDPGGLIEVLQAGKRNRDALGN